MPKQKPGRSKQDYSTPENLVRAILKRLDIPTFQHDFAADKTNAVTVRFGTSAQQVAARLGHGAFWTEQDDSLSKKAVWWARACKGGWGWLNPPFANIGVWAKQCLQAMKNGAHIAFLVPASVGSNWYRDYTHQQPGVTVLFLNGRPSFDGVAGFPKDCMLVLFQGGRRDGELRPFSSEVWTWKETTE
jgi:hypothetical protein